MVEKIAFAFLLIEKVNLIEKEKKILNILKKRFGYEVLSHSNKVHLKTDRLFSKTSLFLCTNVNYVNDELFKSRRFNNIHRV